MNKKNAAARIGPLTRTHTHRKNAPCGRSKCMSTCYKGHQKTTIEGNLQAKCTTQNADTHTHFVRACGVEPHVEISQEHFAQTFTREIPWPRMIKEHGHTFCASVRSRNAGQNSGRTSLIGNSEEKCRGPAYNADEQG